jgi:hypothetical protein
VSLLPSSRLWVVGVVFSCLAGVMSAQSPEAFKVRLTMMPVEVATRGLVTGSGSGSAILEGRQLTLSGSFEGMRGPATVAHVHEGPTKGVRGLALFDLTVASEPERVFTGELDLTPEQVESLRQGRLYVQINSVSAPDGNLWGWLLPE